MTFKMHKEGLDLVKRFEGLVRLRGDGKVHVYPDVAHGWKWATQGYGTTSNPDTGKRLNKESPPITPKRAEIWLNQDLEKKYGPRVAALTKAELSDMSMSALTSFAYNVGVGAYKGSTLRKRVNAGRFRDVPREFRKWRFANGKEFRGLVRRREAEQALFMKGLKEEKPKPKEASSPVKSRHPAKPPVPPKKRAKPRKKPLPKVGRGGWVTITEPAVAFVGGSSKWVSNLFKRWVLWRK